MNESFPDGSLGAAPMCMSFKTVTFLDDVPIMASPPVAVSSVAGISKRRSFFVGKVKKNPSKMFVSIKFSQVESFVVAK